jgi:hypothetical protein
MNRELYYHVFTVKGLEQKLNILSKHLFYPLNFTLMKNKNYLQ